MPVTKDQVLRYLDVDEPDYEAAARLGPNALVHLKALALEAGPGLAAKAVHLASLIGGDAATPVIDAAADRADPVLRVAAAAALSRVPEDRMADIAVRLLADADRGVRHRVFAALPPQLGSDLRDRLGDLADSLPAGEHRDDLLDALRKRSAR